MFEWIKLFLELSDPFNHGPFHIFDPLLEYLIPPLLYPRLVILMMFLLLLNGYLLLDMLSQEVHLLLDTVGLDCRRRVLAQRALNLRDHLASQVLNQRRQLVVSDVQQVLLQLRDQLD